jgi:hypothetical protein
VVTLSFESSNFWFNNHALILRIIAGSVKTIYALISEIICVASLPRDIHRHVVAGPVKLYKSM